MSDETLHYLIELSDSVKGSSNIWEALGHLTNALGSDCGKHLEILLLKYKAQCAKHTVKPKKLTHSDYYLRDYNQLKDAYPGHHSSFGNDSGDER